MALLMGAYPVFLEPPSTTQNLQASPTDDIWSSDSAADASKGGGFDAEFSPAPEQKYFCPICIMVLRDPMQTNCGHRFCRFCLFQWLRDASVCPVCKATIQRSEIFPDNYAKREILGLTVRCPNSKNGCDTILELRDVESHLSLCQEKQQLCKYCSQLVTSSEMSMHLNETCSAAVVHCKFHNIGCSEQCERQNMAMHNLRYLSDHLDMLARYVLTSDRSGVDSKVTSILQTLTLTDKDLDSQSYSRAGLIQKWKCFSKHVSECSDDGREDSLDHGILHREKSSSKGSSPSSAQRTTKSVGGNEDRDTMLKTLERTVKDQAKKLFECTEYIKRLEHTIYDLGTRSNHGTYIWKITDFKRRYQEAKSNKNSILYSPGFYSSYYGYKTCLRVHLNGTGAAWGKYLSLFIHFMPGEFDDILHWPFQGRITLSILDQNDTSKVREDIRENMEPSPYLEAFERPKEIRNHKGFGYLEFVSLPNLLGSNYVKRDTIYIKAFVDNTV